MKYVRTAFSFLLFAIATACSGNGTILESESPIQATYVSSEYGDREPDGIVPVQVGDQTYDFRVWIGTKHPRILVRTTKAGAEASAGSVSKFSLGVIERPLDMAPYQEAATRHLAKSGRTGCTLRSGAQLSHLGFEWSFECAQSSPTAPAPKRPARS